MLPGGIAAGPSLRRRPRLVRISLEPFSDVEPIELFAPQEAREGPAGDEALLLGQPVRKYALVELVGLIAPILEDRVVALVEHVAFGRTAGQPQPDRDRGTGRDGVVVIPERRLGAGTADSHR